MRSAILACLLVLPLEAQSFQRNEITFSGGITWGIASFDPYDTAVSLGATYGYRVRPWFEPEAGVFAGINPYRSYCNASGCHSFDSRFIWVPFGLRFNLPLRQDRFELSAGLGGVYQNAATPSGTMPSAATSSSPRPWHSIAAGISGWGRRRGSSL